MSLLISLSLRKKAELRELFILVNSCLAAQINIEPEFKVILTSMTTMADHWQLAGKIPIA